MAEKNIDELRFDKAVYYSKEHTWAKKQDALFVVGISDYAQNQLGDIVFIELPQPGDRFSKDDVFGFIESAKTVSDLYMPIDGEVVEINESLLDVPEEVNNDPFGSGWLIKIKAEDPSQFDGLLDAKAYQDSL